MSGRALQRLRKEREKKLAAKVDEEDDDSSDEDEVGNQQTRAVGFGGLMDESDSESSDSSDSNEDSDNEKEKEDETKTTTARLDGNDPGENQPTLDLNGNNENINPPEQSEDLDAILEEFKSQDAQRKDDSNIDDDNKHGSCFSIITFEIDVRDLDIDYVTRTSLLGRNETASGGTNRRGRQSQIFGPPRDGWPRPPRYVGGGIGMTSYKEHPHPLPWPYCDMKEGDDRCPSTERWFKFTQSDSYIRDAEDFEQIKQSGDPNAMCMFASHHPFFIESLLQLSALCYQTNRAQEGLSFLKRSLWVFDCACLNTFLKWDGTDAVMDFELPLNNQFFKALFRLIQVARVAGLSRACLAVSRLLLSLDPLRDPMGILLAIDHFALLENSEIDDSWLVDFVESEKVRITWRDKTSSEEYECGLLDLPNWAYSYALALRRISLKDNSPESEQRANDAITMAFKRFPLVLEDLLHKNEVDIKGRSFQNDWPSALEFAKSHATQLSDLLSKAHSGDPVLKARISQSCDTIAHIFVQQNYKLWSSDNVLRWCCKNLQQLKESNVDLECIPQASPAAIRYERAEASDYEDRFQTLPADAVPLDPGLLAHAQIVDINRRRMMQRVPRVGMNQEHLAFAANQEAFAGPPTQEIDPDWPLLEVFWRSALPWAHVEGVPPPPPPR